MNTIRNLKPAFCRQGNKYDMRSVIIPLIHEHKRYVELFAGSGAIFWNKEKAEENILNDLDRRVAGQFDLLKRAPLDPSKYDHNLDTIQNIKEFFSKTPQTVADELILEKIRTSNGFCCKPVKSEKYIYKKCNPVKLLKHLGDYKDMLKGVEIENTDYSNVVNKYDSPDTFFFIDPPYENTDKTFEYAEDTKFDYEKLRDVLVSIKGKFLMTINDSPRTRELYKQFNIKPIDVYAAWMNREKNKVSSRKELIITNYIKVSRLRGL